VAGDARIDRDGRRHRDGDHRGTPRGARQLSALLPNGRTIWLRVDRAFAPVSATRELAQFAASVARRRRSETSALAAAIARLSKVVEADADRLEKAKLHTARRFRRRLVAADHKLDVRLSRAREEFMAKLEKQLEVDRENVRRLRRRDLWDKILIASSLPLFAAYGQRASPFSGNNLTLTLSLLIFLAGDHVVEEIFEAGGRKAPYALDDADAWSYLAPVGNLLAGWWLLGDRQHQRFVTGVTTIKMVRPHPALGAGPLVYRFRKDVELWERIGKDHFQDFATFEGVPAVATLGALRVSAEAKAMPINMRIEGLRARVDEGVLKLSLRVVPDPPLALLPSTLGEVDIAWMVDTDKPVPPESR
jgi:hypothetical protein